MLNVIGMSEKFLFFWGSVSFLNVKDATCRGFLLKMRHHGNRLVAVVDGDFKSPVRKHRFSVRGQLTLHAHLSVYRSGLRLQTGVRFPKV